MRCLGPAGNTGKHRAPGAATLRVHAGTRHAAPGRRGRFISHDAAVRIPLLFRFVVIVWAGSSRGKRVDLFTNGAASR